MTARDVDDAQARRRQRGRSDDRHADVVGTPVPQPVGHPPELLAHVAVEPAGSVTFGGPPGKRKIPGIGTSVRPRLADLAKPDRIVWISEERTVESCLSFVRDHHLLIGGSTGTVLAAVQQFAPEFKAGDTIVAISPDLGEKYLDTVYDPEWVARFITAEDDSRLEQVRPRKLSVVPRPPAARAVTTGLK
jgi:threonine synthase